MSLYGAMFSGVSGLNAQSQAMSVISDNISNVNTTGYKATASRFSTMVTMQSLAHGYAPGGVLFNRQALIDQQGLLQSSSSPTDVGISGEGMFVVRGQTNGGPSDPYFYTRAGSFVPDEGGFLKNTAGYYLMGWPTDATGEPIPTNTTALSSLEAVNVSGVAGSATPTTEIALGLNLPALSDPGSTYNTPIRIYDSLGVTHDMTFEWNKIGLNQWGVSMDVPEGATQLTMTDDTGAAYHAAGRLDFSSQPADGDSIVIGGVTYEFDTGDGVGAGNTAVTIGADTESTVSNLATAIGDPRVTASTTTLNIVQIRGWPALAVNASGASTVAQSATGAFTIPALTAGPAVTLPSNTMSFSAVPTDGETIVVNGTTYEFDTDGTVGAGNTAVDVATAVTAADAVTALATAIGDPRITANGADLDFDQTLTGAAITVDGSGTAVATPTTAFTVAAYDPDDVPAITFSGTEGAPSAINVAGVEVSGWLTGAGDSDIALNLGTVGVKDGLTQYADAYSIEFNNQNGVQFGTFSGVAISEEGLVVALFDNGETLPIYQLALATFSNVNGMIAKTGNVYTSSDTTGEPILREPKSGGAGTVASGALENSTVDLGTEFTNMIIAQRAYSAATKIITTADEMLDELVRIKR